MRPVTQSETIFALSSGPPPSAIAVIRISGPRARIALETMVGRVPEPRRATFTEVCDPATGELIDEGLALWFPGPKSETGEDTAELQVHGGRAVIAAMLFWTAASPSRHRLVLEHHACRFLSTAIRSAAMKLSSIASVTATSERSASG